MDESRPQTQAILVRQRQQQTLAGLAQSAQVEPMLSRHWNFQRLLRPLVVVNPYAEQLTYGDDRLQCRRDQPKYLNLVRVVALLRQMQKPIRHCPAPGGGFDYIEVDRGDLRLANQLTTELLGHRLDELSRPAFDLLMQLESMSGTPGAGFTRREIRERTGWTHARVHRYLRELLVLEYVVPERGNPGQLQSYRLLYQGEGKDGRKFCLGLPAAEALREPSAASGGLGKGRKQRVVPIGQTALRFLTSYVKAVRPLLAREPGQAALFLDDQGRRLPYHTFRRRVQHHTGGLGLPVRVTPTRSAAVARPNSSGAEPICIT